MNNENTIGARIKKRRKELNLTQTQIKQLTGISSGNLSDIENGNKLPSASAIIQLSDVLNCTTDWILKGDSHESEILYTENVQENNDFTKSHYDMQLLYARIKDIADKMKLSGNDLGILLGLKKSPLTDWKNGKSCPTLEQLIKMCDIFAVSSDYLLFGANNFKGKADMSELNLLTFYRDMSPSDQEELLMIAELKYNKKRKKKGTLSHSKETEKLA